MRWGASLCRAAAMLAAAPAGAAASDGRTPRVELAGDVVDRDSLESGVAAWVPSTDSAAIQVVPGYRVSLRQSFRLR